MVLVSDRVEGGAQTYDTPLRGGTPLLYIRLQNVAILVSRKLLAGRYFVEIVIWQVLLLIVSSEKWRRAENLST